MFRSAVESILQYGTRCRKINAVALSAAPRYRGLISTRHSYDRQFRSVHVAHNATQINVVSNAEEHSQMMKIWPDVVEDILEIEPRYHIPESMEWLKTALEYLVPNDQLHRGLLVINSYRQLAGPQKLTDKDMRLARILAWCAEIWEATFLLQNDMMTQSEQRRGKVVWSMHSKNGVGAINDTIAMEQAIYQLLHRHFKNQPCYMNLLHTFHEITLTTTLGQAFDLHQQIRRKPNFDLFTMDNYERCCNYKDIFVYGPIVIAMYFAGIDDPDLHRETTNIMKKIGCFSQIQDDYLDVFGEPSVTRKTSNDIQIGKASWLAITALQLASPQQRKMFEECYGDDDLEKVALIKDLYEQLALPKFYETHQKKFYNDISLDIEKLSDRPLRQLLLTFVDQVNRQNYLL